MSIKKRNRFASIVVAVNLILMMIPLTVAPALAADPGTYNPGDIVVINSIIANNGLGWTTAEPDDGSYVPEDWEGVFWSPDDTDMRIIGLFIDYCDLTGSLNVSGLADLQWLECSGNQLSALDVSGLDNLYNLFCSENNLATLNVSGLLELGQLDCRYNQLTTLNASGLPNLEVIDCNDNDLATLNVSGLPRLWGLFCGNNRLTTLNASGLDNLETLICSGNLLTTLNISGLASMRTLDCSDNQLTTLDLSGLVNLADFDCSGNRLTALDVSGLDNLMQLYCSYNQLTALDVSGLDDLALLYCSGNRLTALTASGLDNLAHLYCSGNQLAALDVSGLDNLVFLYCDNNRLTALDVSGLDKLMDIYCEGNQLTTLDVSGLANLEYLDCSFNQLASLNVSGLANLVYLCCDENQLTELDVSGLNNLTQMFCYGNQLKRLDVSGLVNLELLHCNSNQLTELDASGLAYLQGLYCSNNELTTLDVSNLSNMEWLDCSGNYITEVRLAEGDHSYSYIDVRHNFLKNHASIIGPDLPWDDGETNFYFSPQREPPSYHPGDIAVINNIIKNNGLNWTLADPANGSYRPDDWDGVRWSDEEKDRRILELEIMNRGLTGSLDVSGLQDLEILNCSNNRLTELRLSEGNSSYRYIDVSYNFLESEDSIVGPDLPWDEGPFIFSPQNVLKVSFDANGGALPVPESITVPLGSPYGELANTTRTGYNFAGWYTARTGGIEVTRSTQVNTTGNQTLYARWVENSPPLQPDQPPSSPTDIGPKTIAITSPATGEEAQSTIASGEGYTGAIEWYNTSDSRSHTGIFLGGKEYRATVTLTSTAGYQWPARAPAISVVGQTVRNGTVDGVGTGNTLTFEVTFAETNEDDDSLPIILEDWIDPDADEYVDDGLEIIVYVGVEFEGRRYMTSYSDEVFQIRGTDTDINADNLVAVYFNRDLLKRGVDYDAEDGSVKITIRAQTFERYGEGEQTIAAVFSINGEAKIAAQKVTVATDIDLGPEILGEFNLFSDVNVGDWFYKYVRWAYENGYMVGVGNGRFAPLAATSEAMITAVLARLGRVDLSQFTVDDEGDIAPGRWFSLTATWAKSNGLLGDRGFSPDGPITRGELAIVLVKFLDYLEIDYDLPATTVEFADAGLMSAEENGAFQILYSLGIFEGVGGNRMVPQGSTNRAQLAALLFRLSDLVNGPSD